MRPPCRSGIPDDLRFSRRSRATPPSRTSGCQESCPGNRSQACQLVSQPASQSVCEAEFFQNCAVEGRCPSPGQRPPFSALLILALGRNDSAALPSLGEVWVGGGGTNKYSQPCTSHAPRPPTPRPAPLRRRVGAPPRKEQLALNRSQVDTVERSIEAAKASIMEAQSEHEAKVDELLEAKVEEAKGCHLQVAGGQTGGGSSGGLWLILCSSWCGVCDRVWHRRTVCTRRWGPCRRAATRRGRKLVRVTGGPRHGAPRPGGCWPHSARPTPLWQLSNGRYVCPPPGRLFTAHLRTACCATFRLSALHFGPRLTTDSLSVVWRFAGGVLPHSDILVRLVSHYRESGGKNGWYLRTCPVPAAAHVTTVCVAMICSAILKARLIGAHGFVPEPTWAMVCSMLSLGYLYDVLIGRCSSTESELHRPARRPMFSSSCA